MEVSTMQAAEGVRHYVYAPDGRVLAEYRAQDDEWRYYLSKRQGSVTGGTDEGGGRTESYGYGPYGEYSYGSGGGTDLSHWRYTGEWLDGDSLTGNGYYKIGLSYCDDSLGRWVPDRSCRTGHQPDATRRGPAVHLRRVQPGQPNRPHRSLFLERIGMASPGWIRESGGYGYWR